MTKKINKSILRKRLLWLSQQPDEIIQKMVNDENRKDFRDAISYLQLRDPRVGPNSFAKLAMLDLKICLMEKAS